MNLIPRRIRDAVIVAEKQGIQRTFFEMRIYKSCFN